MRHSVRHPRARWRGCSSQSIPRRRGRRAVSHFRRAVSESEGAFSAEVICASSRLFSWRTISSRTAVFRQTDKDVPQVHHDALEFPDGTFVLLTDLHEGQQATVLQLPAQPKTSAEAAAQYRVVYVDCHSFAHSAHR